MIHSRKLDMPCPKCNAEGQFGVLFVGKNQLVRGCSKCDEVEAVPLPELTKAVLYLDQFFLSAAFRENQRAFVEVVDRIRQLAQQQLLVCPWSDLHETETHQWSDARQKALWEFVKKTAGGHKFSHSASIKHTQIAKGFDAFSMGNPTLSKIDMEDAFDTDVHQWDNYVWIDIRKHIEDSADVRNAKTTSAKGIAGLFESWRNHPQSFEQDIRDECRGYVTAIERDYAAYMASYASASTTIGDLLGTWSAQVFNSLMIAQDSSIPFEDRLARVRRFLRSEFFAAVPHVDASCRIFASLRKAVRRGELPTTVKAERAMFGFGQDMEMVSTFAPYTDAIFVDRAMHRWIADAECDLSGRYGFRVFSVATWDEFHAFLDLVENSKSKEHNLWLKAVYG